MTPEELRTAQELFRAVMDAPPRTERVAIIADAIRAQRAAAESSALERAARGCESMVIGGRAWTEEQAIAAKALFAAAEGIRAIASPAAAPAAEPRDVVTGTARETYAGIDFTRGTEPVAPSLLPRVLAALEEHARCYSQPNRHDALAAELRRYIAEMEGKK